MDAYEIRLAIQDGPCGANAAARVEIARCAACETDGVVRSPEPL
jgi:hypothetical protein